MPPKHVTTLEDYWLWVQYLVVAHGGHTSGDMLIVEVTEGQDGEWLSLHLPQQRIDFWVRPVSLWFSMTVRKDFELSKYSFHFQDQDGRQIWRKDNVHRHKHLRRAEHIHDRRGLRNFQAVDLEEALGEARAYNERSELP